MTADLLREYLLAGHLIDRAAMPHVIAEFGREAMEEVAIEEWMAASPIYTRRIQRALRFGGTDVATIFKGMQFDIGAPPEFMDFRFRVDGEDRGEFWLASCGALMDVEPLGDEYVVAVCHHIEDPTFDATAAATNPRARVRPVHRPPRQPADRHPHCHWTVRIDPAAEPLPAPAAARRLAQSRAARLELPTEAVDDYAGPFDPDLRYERFSPSTLARLLDEVALQGHLLARAFMLAVGDRWGGAAARRIGARALTGVAGVVAKRLSGHLRTDDVAEVIDAHPAFRPRAYIDASVERRADSVHIEIRPCPALEEGDQLSWPALLATGHEDAIAAMATAVDPHAVVERSGEASWVIGVDKTSPPAPVPNEVLLTEFSTGASFQFKPHRSGGAYHPSLSDKRHQIVSGGG